MERLAILGGDPVRSAGYPSWPDVSEADVEAVTAAVRAGGWGGHPVPGPLAASFGRRFAAFQGADHGVVMMNGTVTLEVALKALGIGWGDEVIVPALTFSATPYAVMAAGALPVIVDVTAASWMIDPDLVEAAITPRTRAIIPVHLGQVMADMDRLTAIAAAHGLAIVEDCAHSHGKAWGERGAGTFGAFGSFSHQSSKILTAGEGGTLLTDDPDLAELASSLIDCGRAKDQTGVRFTFGANYRLGELHAALLLSQLDRFPAQMAERAENATYFESVVGAVPGVRPLTIDPRVSRRSFYRYILAIDPDAFAGADGAWVCAALEAEGVGAWIGYPSLSRDELFQPGLSRMPVAVAHADRLDPARMGFPVADRAGAVESVYLLENVFRAGRPGIDDAVEALAKVQRLAGMARPSTAGRASG